MKRLLAIVLLASGSIASANIQMATLDAGGGLSGNGNIENLSSIGGIIGTISEGDTVALEGFIAQITEVQTVTLSATPETIDEAGIRQLTATVLLDDSSTLVAPGTDLQWALVAGPIDNIDVSGLATADIVFEDSTATVRGIYLEVQDDLILTILNTDPDNYLSYASDAIDDDWQVSFFGLPPNSNAAAIANPDGDPFDNLAEFLTGYDPTDPSSFFRVKFHERNGSSASLEMSKIIPARIYVLERKAELTSNDPWTTVIQLVPVSESSPHVIEDVGAASATYFYRITVSN